MSKSLYTTEEDDENTFFKDFNTSLALKGQTSFLLKGCGFVGFFLMTLGAHPDSIFLNQKRLTRGAKPFPFKGSRAAVTRGAHRMWHQPR